MIIKSAVHALSPAGSQGKLSIFIFHRVLSKPDPLFPDEMDCPRFRQVVRWIAQWFNVLSLDDAVTGLSEGSLPARAAVITFDDGYADNLTNAVPILAESGLNACFFIATGFLDGGIMWNDRVIEAIRQTSEKQLRLDWPGLDEINLTSLADKQRVLPGVIKYLKYQGEQRAMQVEQLVEACKVSLPQDFMLSTAQLLKLREAGMEIGAHTVNHPILARIPDEEAKQEISASKKFLENILGDKVNYFAYPNGKYGEDYNESHADMVKEFGFKAAVSTNWGISSKETDVYQLKRFTPWGMTRLKFGAQALKNYF